MKSKLMLATALAVAVTVSGAAYAKPDANQMAAVADKARPEADSKRDADRKHAQAEHQIEGARRKRRRQEIGLRDYIVWLLPDITFVGFNRHTAIKCMNQRPGLNQ